jgi:hypothetical protein
MNKCPLDKEKCFDCGEMAVWLYLPGDVDWDPYYCDKHVPRGCSCNEFPKEDIKEEDLDINNPEHWEEELDGQGRRFPCCEYLYSENGFDKDREEE